MFDFKIVKHNKNLTFSELIEIYKSYKLEHYSESNIKTSKGILNKLKLDLGKYKASDINTPLIQAYINHYAKQKLAKGTYPTIKTQKNLYKMIQAILNWAVRFDYLEVNKVKYIDFVNNENTNELQSLTAEEIANVLTYTKQYHYNIYIPILLCTMLGLRRSETLALRWNNINFDTNIISINESVVIGENNKTVFRNKLKTQSSKRKIAISNFLKNELLEFQNKCKALNNDYVCINIFTNKLITPDYLSKQTSEVCSKISNKHIRLHDLRHSFCQIGYDLDIDLSTRSKLLGHSNIKTTNNIYTDYSAKKTASAVEQINNEISKYIKNASTD